MFLKIFQNKAANREKEEEKIISSVQIFNASQFTWINELLIALKLYKEEKINIFMNILQICFRMSL